MSLDTVLDLNKKETEKKIVYVLLETYEQRELIFEEEEDPFNVNTINVKTLERSDGIPSLETGLNNNTELKDAIQNNQIIHLIKEDGSVGVGTTAFFEEQIKLDKSGETGTVPHVVSLLGLVIPQKVPSKPPRQFWELVTPEMTPEVKRELEILSMRGYWDTKSFFKVRFGLMV